MHEVTAGRWIPITESLPPLLEPVVGLLVWIEDCYTEARALYRSQNGDWVDAGDRCTRYLLDDADDQHAYVTHWCPLPADPHWRQLKLVHDTAVAWSEAGINVSEVVPVVEEADDAE